MTTEMNKLNELVPNGDYVTWSDFRGDCERILYRFDNGFGASIVCHSNSYGGYKGLLELAVTWKDELCYDTDITCDVIGWLDCQATNKLLNQIKNLPKRC